MTEKSAGDGQWVASGVHPMSKAEYRLTVDSAKAFSLQEVEIKGLHRQVIKYIWEKSGGDQYLCVGGEYEQLHPDGHAVVQVVCKILPDSIRVDQPIDPSKLRIEYPDVTTVYDETTKKVLV